MKRLLVLGIASLIAAGPAYAADTMCATTPSSQWQPQSKLESLLKGKGYTVKQIKVENGCYEVYAYDAKGKRANMAFNAQTLKQLANAEAGEG